MSLSNFVSYSTERVNKSDVLLENYVTTENLLPDKSGLDQSKKLPAQEGNMNKYLRGNILVSNIRPYLKKIWYADKEGGCSSDVLVFNVKDTHNSKFVYYAMLSDGFFEHMMRGSKGTKMPRGDKRQILEFKVPEYDLPVQNKITAVLSAVDTKIKINKTISSQLEDITKQLYHYWFVQFDFPMSASQAAALGKPHLTGKPYRASGGKMVYNEILKRDIPEGWTDDSLEKLGKIIGGSTPSTKVEGHFNAVGTPWISPKDLSDNLDNRFITRGALGVTEKGIKAASLKLLPAGTVLMSSRAPIGYLAVAKNPVTTNQGFKSVVPNGKFSTDYIYFTLKHFMMLIHANASGTTFKEISGGTLKAVKIHFPPADLVKEFTKFSSSLSSQRSVLEQQNQELTQLRDWLLPMLMNGQVTVA